MKKNLMPGKEYKHFIIHFDKNWFPFMNDNVNSITKSNIDGSNPKTYRIVKKYKRTLWRQFITWLGFKTKLFLLTPINDEKDN